MKTTALLLTLALILPSVSAAITFSLAPASQNANPGDTVTVRLWAYNDQAIWGASAKIDFSTITYSSSIPGAAIAGSFSGVTQNTPTRITPYAVFPGNTPGMPAGNNKMFDLRFTIPQSTQPGQYQLTLSQPAASDQNGNSVQAGNAGPVTITVQGAQQPTPTPEQEIGVYLPKLYGKIEQTIDVPICVSNTVPGRTLTNLDITILSDQNIVTPTEAEIVQGNGYANVQPGSAQITITGLNVQNADCEHGTGAYVAYLHYHLRSLGVSTLHFQSASATDQTAQPFSIQALENGDGQITVGTPQATKHCTPNLGIIAKDQAVTITYKLSNPGKPTTISNNIGGVYNEDTFDDTNFNPTVPPTNLQAGSTLTHSYTGGSGKIDVVQTESPQPFLIGPGTFNIYSIVYDSIPAIPTGMYTFDFNPPPPPALEVSDEFSNDMTAGKVSCQVQVIEQCNQNSDCDDDLECNGQETCSEGDCVPGTPPDCDDDNQCTNDFCQEPSGCQHTSIPDCGGTPKGGSGGGTSGGGQQTAYICAQCNNTDHPEYDKCCGINQKNAERFCRKPTAYKQFCVLFGQAKPPTIELPAQETIPVQPEVQASQGTSEERKVNPPKQHLAGKAISEGKIQSIKGLTPWIIGALAAILLMIFAATVMTRRKPEQAAQAEIPIPIEIKTEKEPAEARTKELKHEEIETRMNKIEPAQLPEIKTPEPVVMKKAVVAKKPISVEKPKAPAPKIIYKPVTPKPVEEAPLNKYEAEVRKKLAKAKKSSR